MHSQFMTNTVVYWYRQMSFPDATYAFTVQHMLFECVGASMQLHSWPESTAASLTAYIHAAASLVMEVEDENRIAPILIFVCCLFFTDSDSNACDSAQRNDESSRESIAASMAIQCMQLPVWCTVELEDQTRVDATLPMDATFDRARTVPGEAPKALEAWKRHGAIHPFHYAIGIDRSSQR